ncbi:MAG TPA: hypothetical protein VH816_06215 [Gaiellaceae bacterium]|jgi:hypothetical protein
MQVFAQRTAPAPDRPGREPAGAELRLLRAAERQRLLRDRPWLVIRALGALSVLAVGAAHLQQYLYLYSAIPTIGTLFVLNFAGATAIGLGLLAPLDRLLGRLGSVVVALLALGGVGLAATAFVFLLVSERTPLFGFMEPGYDPPAIMATRVAELAAVGLLGSFLLARLATGGRAGRW